MKKTVSLIALIVVLILAGCAAQPSPPAEVTVTPRAEPTIEPCDLTPVAVLIVFLNVTGLIDFSALFGLAE